MSRKEYNLADYTKYKCNREAFRMLDEAGTFDEKVRQSEKIGASAVGESIDIIQNADYAFVVNKMQNTRYDENGDIEYTDRYLFVKLIASRGRQTAITSFKHRFVEDNDMALIEDLNTRPVSTLTINEFINDRVNQNGQRTKGKRTIV